MFFQKVSDPVEEATVAAGAIAEPPQDQPVAAPRHQGVMAVQHRAQVPGQRGQALAEVMAAVPLDHRARVQHGRAAQYDRNRTQ